MPHVSCVMIRTSVMDGEVNPILSHCQALISSHSTDPGLNSRGGESLTSHSCVIINHHNFLPHSGKATMIVSIVPKINDDSQGTSLNVKDVQQVQCGIPSLQSTSPWLSCASSSTRRQNMFQQIGRGDN